MRGTRLREEFRFRRSDNLMRKEWNIGKELQNQSRIKNIFQNEFRRVFGMEIKLTFQFSTTNDKRWRKRKDGNLRK